MRRFGCSVMEEKKSCWTTLPERVLWWDRVKQLPWRDDRLQQAGHYRHSQQVLGLFVSPELVRCMSGSTAQAPCIPFPMQRHCWHTGPSEKPMDRSEQWELTLVRNAELPERPSSTEVLLGRGKPWARHTSLARSQQPGPSWSSRAAQLQGPAPGNCGTLPVFNSPPN